LGGGGGEKFHNDGSLKLVRSGLSITRRGKKKSLKRPQDKDVDRVGGVSQVI